MRAFSGTLIVSFGLSVVACSGADGLPVDGSGGTVASNGGAATVGGNVSTGGNSNSKGGAPSNGGTTSVTGGSSATQGGSATTGGAASTNGGSTQATGGKASTGGAATGGKAATGGAATGGKAATGGAATGGTATGGKASTGGTTATGGKAATGGATATGGAATGGSTATGGVATGGKAATGGAATGGVATGGKAATGGSTATGGAATGGKAATGGSTATGGAGVGGGTVNCSAAMPTGGTVHQSSNAQGTAAGLTWTIWSNYTGGSITTYSTPAFSASWANCGDYLARIGLQWNNTKTYDQYGTITAQFAYKRTGTGGGYSYVGIYGWSTNPCVEYYIVDDSYNTMPVNPGNTTLKGTADIDGGTYNLYTRNTTGTGGSKCSGVTSWIQFYSVRKTARQCGEISITKHFDAWKAAGMTLGKMDQAQIFVEVGGGTGSAEFSTANVTTTL